MSRVRLLPVLIFGLVSLLSIKLLSIALNLPSDRLAMSAGSGDRFARSITRAREGAGDDHLITGAIGKKDEKKDDRKDIVSGKTPETEAEKAELERLKTELKARQEAEGTKVNVPNTPAESAAVASPAERAILEKLRERRGEIEAKDRELDMRDSLLKVTERKLDERIGELKTLESQFGAAGSKGDAKSRYRPLVVMYENMKPKEAARVFDRLDTRVLIEIVGHMNPRKVSEILAVMEAGAAEKLTLALARQAAQGDLATTQAPPRGETELPRLPVSGTPRR